MDVGFDMFGRKVQFMFAFGRGLTGARHEVQRRGLEEHLFSLVSELAAYERETLESFEVGMSHDDYNDIKRKSPLNSRVPNDRYSPILVSPQV